MDFMTDALADGRRFRVLNVVDHFSRECLASELGRSLTGRHMVAVLDRLIGQRGTPEVILSDNVLNARPLSSKGNSDPRRLAVAHRRYETATTTINHWSSAIVQGSLA